MSRANRGQVSGPTIPIGLLIAVFVVGIVANELMTIGEIKPGPDVNHLCNGFWGCGGPEVLDIVVPAALIIALVVAITVARWKSGSTEGESR